MRPHPLALYLSLTLLAAAPALAQPHPGGSTRNLTRPDLSGHWRSSDGGSVYLGSRASDDGADRYQITFRPRGGDEVQRTARFDGRELILDAPEPKPNESQPGVIGRLEGDGGADVETPAAPPSIRFLLSSRRPRPGQQAVPTQVFRAQGAAPVQAFRRAAISIRIDRVGLPMDMPLVVGKRSTFRLHVEPKARGKTRWTCDVPGTQLEPRPGAPREVRVTPSRPGSLTLRARFRSRAGSQHTATIHLRVAPRIETVKVVAVTFHSDHGRLKDNTTTWANSGKLYGEPEWTGGISSPISHTMDTTVRVTVQLDVGPADASPTTGELHGEGPHGLRFAKQGVKFTPGRMSVSLDSGSTGFAKRIQKLDARLQWSVKGLGTLARVGETRNTVYVTMGTPNTPSRNPGVTVKRMDKAVEAAGGALSLDPRKVVKTVIRKWNRYNLRVAYRNAWKLGNDKKDPKTGKLVGADCQTIVRFTQNVIQMVGCPGRSEYVVVYGRVPQPTKGLVSVNAVNHMTSPYQYYNDHNTSDRARTDWVAVLVDSGGGLNNYEAALRFTYKGKRYYPGGVNATFKDPDQVLGVFTTMSWVDLYDLSAGPKEHIHNYRP